MSIIYYYNNLINYAKDSTYFSETDLMEEKSISVDC